MWLAFVWAEPGLLGSTKLVVAITAHAFGVVSLVCVWTVCDGPFFAVINSSCGVRSWDTRHDIASCLFSYRLFGHLLLIYLVILTFLILLRRAILFQQVFISLNEAKSSCNGRWLKTIYCLVAVGLGSNNFDLDLRDLLLLNLLLDLLAVFCNERLL